ncbi:hypothetical protein GCM10025879_10820 [Leuconostoc litchii]|nr:hypothetical protein GCM10025879_10820 [Leuconostoc litchii]
MVFSLRSGIGEEFIYRVLIMSILVSVFQKYKHGPIYAIITQAILFGILHLINILSGDSISATISSTIDAFGIGIFFGVLYLLTKNIGIIVIIHSLWDLMQSVVTGTGNMSVPGIEGLIISISVMSICVIYSVYLISQNTISFESSSVKQV